MTLSLSLSLSLLDKCLEIDMAVQLIKKSTNSDLNFIFCVKGMNVQSHRISPFMSRVWWMEESGEDKNLFSAVKCC